MFFLPDTIICDQELNKLSDHENVHVVFHFKSILRFSIVIAYSFHRHACTSTHLREFSVFLFFMFILAL